MNAYTLVVAVALSAQATDAGVNRATRALFAVADTPHYRRVQSAPLPADMKALGERLAKDERPFVILGGIYTGLFTPTESAIVAIFLISDIPPVHVTSGMMKSANSFSRIGMKSHLV